MKVEPDSAYLRTRLKLFSGRLMSLQALSELASESLAEVIQRINSEKGRTGQQLDESGRGIGHYLSQIMFDDFQMLLRPFYGIEYRFLKHAMRWFELVNLKVLIRGKFTGVSEAALAEQLVELGYFADLPLRRLVETDDPFEMLRLLEQTTYGGIVRQARRVYEEQGHDLFSLDSAIDRNFFIDLAHRARYLRQCDQTALRAVFGALMDRFNLLWLLRYRFSYGLSAAKAYYLLTATGQYLHAAELMSLARFDVLGDVIDALPPRLHELLRDGKDMFQLEQLMELYSLSAAKKGLSSPSVIAQMFSYLLLREAETRYLIAIVKGKQLGLDDVLISEAIGGQG